MQLAAATAATTAVTTATFPITVTVTVIIIIINDAIVITSKAAINESSMVSTSFFCAIIADNICYLTEVTVIGMGTHYDSFRCTSVNTRTIINAILNIIYFSRLGCCQQLP
jgi:hypothetical protein